MHLPCFVAVVVILVLLLADLLTISTYWYKYGNYNQPYYQVNYYNMFIEALNNIDCNKTSQFESIAAYCNQTNTPSIIASYCINSVTSAEQCLCPLAGNNTVSTAIMEAYNLTSFKGDGKYMPCP